MALVPKAPSGKKGLPAFNPFSSLRLAPLNEFEGLIKEGFATDMFGWFQEAWLTMRGAFPTVLAFSLPGIIASCASFYMYYSGAGRGSTASDALFGSYARTILIMTLSLLPAIVTLRVITRADDGRHSPLTILKHLLGFVITAAAAWAPLIFSGLMKELGSTINWWAIPIALYLAVSFSFAPFLIADGGLGPWQALETSRRAVSRNWFGIAGLYAVFYPAAWVFSAAISMIPGVFSTIIVVDDMAKKARTDPINIMLGISNVFMAFIAYLFIMFFQIVLSTAYVRIFRPVGYKKK